MSRSISKLIYVHRSQFPKFFYNKTKINLRKKLYKYVNEKAVKLGIFYVFWKRNSVLTRKLINKKFALYNGGIFHIIKTTEKHLGYRLGEFTTTWRSPIHKGKQRQKKKKEKVKKNLNINKYSAFFKKSKVKVSNRQKQRDDKTR